MSDVEDLPWFTDRAFWPAYFGMLARQRVNRFHLALGFGSRNHTRYGYADFLQEGRRYGMMFRVFPGTHKFLFWGDTVSAAAHARAFTFCGSDGAGLLEPLAFKGRRGSGIAGGRCAYMDADDNPAPDWEKFRYAYLLWGRLLYNPDCTPDVWRRLLRARFGESAGPVESAAGAATRILPLVSTAHTPSAAQDTYSPEFYTNQSIVRPPAPAPICRYEAPPAFTRGAGVELALDVQAPAAPRFVRLWYRRVNQAERYMSSGMRQNGGAWQGAIPAAYSDSPFALQYYFEGGEASGRAWLHPGLSPELTGQPYFVIRQR